MPRRADPGNEAPLTSRPAVFLDRDGTLVDDPGYLDDPSMVRVLPGVAHALRALRHAGYLRIVISNQSGIGRGRYDVATFQTVQRAVDDALADDGADVDTTYFCPHLPDAGCPCRKPGTALHREAVARFDIDLAASWCVGDRLSDVNAAATLGAQAILVLTGDGARHASAARSLGIPVAFDLQAAVATILGPQKGG